MEKIAAAVVWRRSSRCDAGNCMEVADIEDDQIGLRDSKLPESGYLRFSRSSWNSFLAGIRAGDFN